MPGAGANPAFNIAEIIQRSGNENHESEAGNGMELRKIHYMLHNIDSMIAKIENRGHQAPVNQKEFKLLLKLMYEVRQYNIKEIKSLQSYTAFIYNIACNVPYSTTEEGQINKTINKTGTKQAQRKAEKGYFYLENLSLDTEWNRSSTFY